MRLEGQSKLGYYPTPDEQTARMLAWLQAGGDGIKALDPCCGQGEALASLARHLRAESYGIELSDTRAAEAKARLDHVLNCGYENAVLTDETFSLTLLNPPYDGEGMTGSGHRLEETFLTLTTPRLMPGGVLIYIVPHKRISETVAHHLAGHYDSLRCYRFAGQDYDAFQQVVILGVRRPAYRTPTGEALRQAQAWAEAGQLVGDEDALQDETDTQRAARVLGEVEAAVGPLPKGALATLKGDALACVAKKATPAMSAWATAARAWLADHPTVLQVKSHKVRRPVLEPLPELPQGGPAYIVPPAPARGRNGWAFCFKYKPVSAADYLRAADEAAPRLEASRAWADLIPPTAPRPISPAMSPKQGHIAMQLSGGLLWTCRLDGGLLLKGHVRKVTDTHIEIALDSQKEKEGYKVTEQERFETALTLLEPDGTMRVCNDPADIAGLLKQHVNALARQLHAQNIPLYAMQPQAWEWAVFDPLSRGRKLPGRDGTGFTDFQRHLAIAQGRVLTQGPGSGFVQAEMGSGKTTMALGVVEYVAAAAARRGKPDGYPALVVGPGIVTGPENWPREIRAVIPDAEGRVVDTAARPVARPITLLQMLLDHQDELDSAPVRLAVQASLRQAAKAEGYQASLDLATWRAFAHRIRDAQDGTLEQEEKVLRHRIGGLAWLGLPLHRDPAHARALAARYSLAEFVRAYRAGELPAKSLAIMSFETAKLGPGRLPAMGVKAVKLPALDENGDVCERVYRVCTCPACGAVVAEAYGQDGKPLRDKLILAAMAHEWVGARRRYCRNPQPKRVWDPESGRHVVQTRDHQDNLRVCGAPLFEWSSLHRQAGAAYVAAKARHVFRLLLVDEVHEAKAKGTGVGWALARLAGVTSHTLGLTGTLFGGNSTSLFWLLYRLSSEVRQSFGFNDDMRWVDRYGLLKRVHHVDDANLIEGTFTGARTQETVSERPGVSPAIAGVLLPCTTFSGLTDIGLPLPTYSEHMAPIAPSKAMLEQLADADGSQQTPPTGLLDWAIKETRRKDDAGKGAVSVWLNTALNRPDAMFRPEVVTFNRCLSGRGRYARRHLEVVRTFKPVVGEGELLPKEAWLLGLCQAQKAAGRKVLVFVRQSGERDIQDRLVEVLDRAGLRAEVLRGSTNPRKRVEWITRHAGELDVLITNARLVKVGLNLTMFSTTVFFEADWSLTTVWQAMRRVYRPGAPRPVEIHFPYYVGTMEERLLALVGKKMKAAQTLYGDDVAGALVEDDDDDLLGSLVRDVLKGTAIGRPEGLFATENALTASPLGSPTAVSPAVPARASLEDLLKALRRGEIQVRRGRGPAFRPVKETVTFQEAFSFPEG